MHKPASYPIALDLTQLPILLIGDGPAFAKRKKQLEEAGAQHLNCRATFAETDLADAVVIMVVGLSYDASKLIADAARAAKKLVNVEDVNELCDFTFTAHIRRGDLLIAVSTNGASPTLAKRVRDNIAHIFDDKWAGYTQAMKELRQQLKAQGKNMRDIMLASEKFLEEKGWLKP